MIAPGTAGKTILHPQDGPHADIRITVGEDAIRFDVTMNLMFVDSIAPTDREVPDELPDVEAPIVEAALVEFFRTENQVTIDGVVVTPRFDGFSVLRPGLELLPLFPRSGMRGLMRVGFDLWYPLKSPPQTIGIVWPTFPPDIVIQGDEPGEPPPLVIQMRLYAEGRSQVMTFTADEPEFIWHATGETTEDRFQPVPAAPIGRPTRDVPVMTLGLLVAATMGLACCGLPRARRKSLATFSLGLALMGGFAAGSFRVEVADPFAPAVELPSNEAALAIFRPLHANIYRAFDYTAEADVYDALSRSVDGRLLDRLYNEIYRSLIMYEEGGAVSRVKSVEPLTAQVLSVGTLTLEPGTPGTLGFQVRARWQVEGEVYHWGHSHTRRNEYEADYTVLSTSVGWRIAASAIREQFRVDLGEDGDENQPGVLPPGTEI